MSKFGEISIIGHKNAVPLPKITAKGVGGSVYNTYAERMYRLFPFRTAPASQLKYTFTDIEEPLRYISALTDPNTDNIRFIGLSTLKKLWGTNAQAYIDYSLGDVYDFLQAEVLEGHTVSPDFVVPSPASDPYLVSIGDAYGRCIGIGTTAGGALKRPLFVQANILTPSNPHISATNTGTAIFDPPFRIWGGFFIETAKERILLPVNRSLQTFNKDSLLITYHFTNVPANILDNIDGMYTVLVWADKAIVLDLVPKLTTDLTVSYVLSTDTFLASVPFDFHTASLPDGVVRIRSIGGRTFYFYKDHIRISKLNRMFDIPDNFYPKGIEGGGGIVEIPDAYDVIPYGSHFFVFAREGVYRLFEPIAGEWAYALLPFPTPRIADETHIFPTPVKYSAGGVQYFAGTWQNIDGTNEAVLPTGETYALLPIVKTAGTEPFMALSKEGTLWVIWNNSFFEIEEGGINDVVVYRGKVFYPKGTDVYEFDIFAPLVE